MRLGSLDLLMDISVLRGHVDGVGVLLSSSKKGESHVIEVPYS